MLLYIFIVSILLDCFDCFLVILGRFNSNLFLLLFHGLFLFLLGLLLVEDISEDGIERLLWDLIDSVRI